MDVRFGLLVRGIYIIGVIGGLLVGLAVSTGSDLGVMGMAISGCLLVGLLTADTDPEPDVDSRARASMWRRDP